MGFINVSDRSLVLLVAAASMLVTVSMANKDWYYGGGGGGGGFNYTANWPWPWGPRNETNKNGPNTIVVGGSDWHFGFNYSVWAFQNAPFYVNDVLVFKYNAPSPAQPFPHSVFLLPNLWSYRRCDFSRARMIANSTQGGGEGFKYKLNRWKPYYFACGEHDGIHCRDGGMKFFVMPLRRRSHY